MKHYSASILTAVLLTAALSCSKTLPAPADGAPEDTNGISFLFDVKSWDCGSASKSSIGFDGISKVNDVNLLVFLDNGNVCQYKSALSGYYASFDKIDVKLDSRYDYKLYFIANAGKSILQDASRYATLEQMKSKLKLSFPSYCRDFREHGMPMVGCCPVEAGTVGKKRVHFERLYSRWSVKIDADGIEMGDIEIKGLGIRNAPTAVYPLADASAIKTSGESSLNEGGDFANAEDIATLKSGGEVTLYILENVQGTLLPENSKCSEKVPENIPDKDPSLLTYICLEAETQSMNNSCGKVLYRSYLGEDNCSDFSIIRNTARSLTMHIYNTDVDDGNWRITPEDPVRVFTPSIGICLRGYLNDEGLWCPEVDLEIADCEQIIKYIGDFRENTSISISADAKHLLDIYNLTYSQYGAVIPRYFSTVTSAQEYSSSCPRYSFWDGEYPVYTFEGQSQGNTDCLRAIIDLSYSGTVSRSKIEAINNGTNTYYEEKSASINIYVDIDFPRATLDKISEIYGKDIPGTFNTIEDWREDFPFNHPSWKMQKAQLMDATTVTFRVNGVTLPCP